MTLARLALSALVFIGSAVVAPRSLPAATPVPVPPPNLAGDEDDPDKEFFNRSVALWEPFDRKVTRGKAITLQFRVQRGYRAPVVSVIYPDGTPEYLHPQATGGLYDVAIPSDPRGGRHRIALIVEGRTGDVHAARFFVEAVDADGRVIDRDVEVPSPDTEYEALDPEEHPLRLERHLFHRMNAFRRKRGLDPLPWNEAVARQCRNHAVEMRDYYELTWDKRVGRGKLVHKSGATTLEGVQVPEIPLIADRMMADEGWIQVVPKLPPDRRETGIGRPSYLSETLTAPDASLDHKFEQSLLRLSDLRAPMMSGTTTHAAGAAVWRQYGLRRFGTPTGGADGGGDANESASETEHPLVDRLYGLRTPEKRRPVAFTILAFVQVNDPRIEQLMARERQQVLKDLKRARGGESEARAFRRVGQYAFRDSPKLCEKGLKDRDPVVRAGALDGLWLCDPGAARETVNAWRLRILRAGGDGRWSRVAVEVRALAGVRFDVRTAREGRRLEGEVRTKARAVLADAETAIAERRWKDAQSAFQAVRKDFDGFPEAEDAALGLRMLKKHPEAGPALGE